MGRFYDWLLSERRVRDDAGEWVELPGARDAISTLRRGDPADRALAKHIRAERWRGQRFLAVPPPSVLLSTLAAPGVVLMMMYSGSFASTIFSALACGVLVWEWFIRPHAIPPSAAESMLQRRRCPGCVSRLDDLPPEDGLVRCPECGARWRKDRLG